MKMVGIISLLFAISGFLSSCEKEALNFSEGDFLVEIEIGENWLHNFPLILGLSKKNAPQFAIWIEDTQGNYLATVFASYKIATEGWVANKGNRRKESLPHWSHQRGVVYSDGLYLPTKDQPLTDGITGATPQSNSSYKIEELNLDATFVIKVELNHSIDFNKHYPEDALPGNMNFSGGPEGSGQPAIIYSGTIFTDTSQVELELIGHSSPDGSDGEIHTELGNLDSALKIVKSIRVTKIQ